MRGFHPLPSALLLALTMDRASVRHPAAVVAAMHLLAALLGTASSRPLLGRLPVPTTTTSAMAVAPAAAHAHQWRGDDAATAEGKWLPFAGAHHLPPVYWSHKPVTRAGFSTAGASPELGLGGVVVVAEAGDAAVEEEEDDEAVCGHGRERRRRQRASTRQEQLTMWASLFNPKGRETSATATGWLPTPGTGIGEAADGAVQSSTMAAIEGSYASAMGHDLLLVDRVEVFAEKLLHLFRSPDSPPFSRPTSPTKRRRRHRRASPSGRRC